MQRNSAMSFRWKAASLEGKLTLLVAAVVASVVGVVAYLDNRYAVRAVEHELLDTSASVADSIAAQFEDGLPPASAAPKLLAAYLHSYHQILEIEVFAVTPNASPSLLASTSAGEPRGFSEEHRAAIRDGKQEVREVTQGGRRVLSVASPVVAGGQVIGGVGVWCSLETADVIARQNRRRALVVVPLSIALLVVLLRWVFIRMVHRPLRELESAMTRAEGGDLEARVRVERPDEIGLIAGGYNRMLGRIRGFNEELSEKVQQATRALNEKNQELRRVNEELYYLQRRLSRIERLTVVEQLAAGFAHKVGTPLNLVSGHLQMLLQTRTGDPALHEKLRLIYSQIEKLTAVVRDMLDDTRKPVVELVPLDLNRLLRRILTLVEPTLALRSVRVETDSDPDLPSVPGDATQLEQVFLTLLNNSLDAMPEGGELRVTTEHVGGFARVRFADTGEGIPDSVKAQIFRPFFTTKEMGRGTGLGLAIVKEILTAHRASIRAESELMRGAAFILEFPVAKVLEKAAVS